MSTTISSNFQDHPFHMVSPSPWPLYMSIALFNLTVNAALSMHLFNYSWMFFYIALLTVISTMAFWFSDMTTEGTLLGNHTLAVQNGLNLGVMLFIISEVMFFVAIFWAFFHSALAPTVELGASWPPLGVTAINPWELPLLNTIMLLSSGVTVTWAHHSMIKGDRFGSMYGTMLTVVLALMFTMFQGIEYSYSSFTLSDGVFGSCFYFATGAHGFHIMMGTIFLAMGFWSIYAYHITSDHHSGMESGMLYWHFVDVVWLFLYVSMYYWGS